MAESGTSNKNNWMLFGISAIITLLMLFFVNEWFWVGLPFTLTYLVLAMDKM